MEGRESEFATIATAFEALLIRKNYGRADMIRDEARPLRFYAVRHWNNAVSAEQCHADAEVQQLTLRLYNIARVTHLVNGAQKADPVRLLIDDRRERIESDR